LRQKAQLFERTEGEAEGVARRRSNDRESKHREQPRHQPHERSNAHGGRVSGEQRSGTTDDGGSLSDYQPRAYREPTFHSVGVAMVWRAVE